MIEMRAGRAPTWSRWRPADLSRPDLRDAVDTLMRRTGGVVRMTLELDDGTLREFRRCRDVER